LASSTSARSACSTTPPGRRAERCLTRGPQALQLD
jgi:hypothetical protein